jgi:hypothetical protein
MSKPKRTVKCSPPAAKCCGGRRSLRSPGSPAGVGSTNGAGAVTGRDSHGPGLFARPVAARSASVSGSTGVPSRSLREPCLAGLAAPDCGRVEQRRRLLHEPGNADGAQPALPKPKHFRGGESLLRLDQQLPMPFPEFVDYAAMTLHAAGKPFLPEAVDVEVSVS